MQQKVAKMIVFHGSVQGIGFRYTTHRIATHHDLTGYVRNLHDGSVEMFAQGDPEDIENCIEDIHGSFGSYIRSVDVTDADILSQYTEFMIKV
jgi:acylphosphatase